MPDRGSAAPTLHLPRLYAILSGDCFAAAPDPAAALFRHAEELCAAGVTWLQYRDKSANARTMLSQARELRRRCPGVTLIMNDRADLCLAAGFDGVHVGQDDLSPEAARAIVGERLWLGVSTHSPEQLRRAAATAADYLAVGPVFVTGSKQNPDPVIGLEGVRAARQRTAKPLVAIGGITRANCRQVVEAGADAVAVISDLLGEPRGAAEEFLGILQSAENRVKKGHHLTHPE